MAVESWRAGLATKRAGSPEEREMFSQLAFHAQNIGDWRDYDELAARVRSVFREEVAAGRHPSVSPFRVQMMPVFTAADEREVGRCMH